MVIITIFFVLDFIAKNFPTNITMYTSGLNPDEDAR